ncbi:MAG TPA: twin-arginine translocation signal domain-containing protein [Terracidiphilus sp.]|jgi:hypothetical protein|nr:twin-arginine translocation signal domain-containing protein [Terracidiphilus sp.]
MGTTRRGFLGMLAGLAAGSAVPAPIRELLTPWVSLWRPADLIYKSPTAVYFTNDPMREMPPHCGQIVIDFKDVVIGQYADWPSWEDYGRVVDLEVKPSIDQKIIDALPGPQ